MDRKAFITELIQAGKDREAVRGELISQGESTAELQEEYDAIIRELRIPEPKPKVPDFVTATAAPKIIHTEVPIPSVQETVMYGINTALSYWREILACSIVLLLPSIAFSLVPPMFMNLPVVLALYLFSAILLVSTIGGYAYMMVRSDERASLFEGLQWVAERMFALLLLVFMTVLLYIGSALLLIIPFFIVSLYCVFNFVALIREDATGMHAFLRSHDLVSGAFAQIGLRNLALMLLGLVFGSLAGLFLLIPIPFFNTALLIFVQLFFFGAYLAGLTYVYRTRAESKPLFDLSSYNSIGLFYWLCILIGLVAACGIPYVAIKQDPTLLDHIPMPVQADFHFWDGGEDVTETIGDTILVSKVKSTAASANLYHNRMSFYDGVCDDISVVEPIQCKDGSAFFMIYVRLPDGTYYCSDSYGSEGVVSIPKESRCQ